MSNGADFHFIFIVDRSGSMSYFNRMGLAIDALSIFIRSLPVDCKFSIISFGTRFVTMKHYGEQDPSIMSYNEASKNGALK